MKKTILFGLMAAALGFTACSDENSSIFNEKPQKGMTLNAIVNGGIDTRATIVNTDAVWPFTFSAGDEVKVTNDLVSDTYTFSKAASYFTCDDATPTASATTWHAYYPSGAIVLTDQSGTIADVAAKYALSGTTETPTTGSPSLSIDMKAKVAILKIVNAGGDIDINIKNSATTWVTGLTADEFNVTSSSTKNSILTTSTAGSYYVVVPAGVQLVIKDEDTAIKSTKSSGFEAGKYYTVTSGVAPWETRLTKGHSSATKIEIETGIDTRPADAANLNAEGTLWETLSSDGLTLKIQTPCKKIIGRDSFDSSPNGLFEDYIKATAITGLEKVDMSEVEDMKNLFADCSSLTSLDVTSLNTKNVISMEGMFQNCNSLTTLDVTKFDTQNVQNMINMFAYCESLTALDVTHFNTANVKEMTDMFAYCESLTALDVTHFNTANVENMNGMCIGCSGLTSLDVTHFNTANVENMNAMFSDCTGLTSLNVANFNTEKVEDMSVMFAGCTGLTSLDLANFNTKKVWDFSSMFSDLYNLASLKLSDNFIFTSVTRKNVMFAYCGRDVVGNGIISNVTDDSIKTNCKENDNSNFMLNTGWGTIGFNMKFEGE